MTAFALAVEVGDWDRLTGASIGASIGLVPSEHSSGQSRSRGPITKTGNTHARRLLVEAAWHHRKPYRPGVILRRRWDQASPAARVRAHAGNQRLHTRSMGDIRACPPGTHAGVVVIGVENQSPFRQAGHCRSLCCRGP